MWLFGCRDHENYENFLIIIVILLASVIHWWIWIEIRIFGAKFHVKYVIFQFEEVLKYLVLLFCYCNWCNVLFNLKILKTYDGCYIFISGISMQFNEISIVALLVSTQKCIHCVCIVGKISVLFVNFDLLESNSKYSDLNRSENSIVFHTAVCYYVIPRRNRWIAICCAKRTRHIYVENRLCQWKYQNWCD